MEWERPRVVFEGGEASYSLPEYEAIGYREWGTSLGDLLAERLEQLAAEMRFLGASTVEGYRDRRDAMLDAAGHWAEARAVAAGL